MILLKVMLLIYSHISSPDSISRLNTFQYLWFRYVCISNLCCLNRKITVLFLPKADMLNETEVLIQACSSLFVLRHITAEHIFEVYILRSAWILQCTSIIGNLLNLCQHTADVWPNSSDSGWGWGLLTSCCKLSNLQFSCKKKLGNFFTRWATSVSQGISGVRVKGFIFRMFIGPCIIVIIEEL